MGLLVSTLVLAGAVAVTGSVLALRLFYVWILVLAAGWLWVRLSIRGLSLESGAIPERACAGSSIQQEVSLNSASRLPRFGLTLQAETDLPGADSAPVHEIVSGRGASLQTNYLLVKRGRFHLGRFRLTATDPFGLFHSRTSLGEARQITVHPQAVPLPPFSLLGLAGSGLSRRLPEALSASASSIREYTTGDSLRHVHWTSTAHTGQYMVKVFDADRSRHRAKNYWVILDMAAPAHSGEGSQSTAEYAVTLAAALARKYIAGGFQFGLIASQHEPVVMPAAASQKHLTDILDVLAVIEPRGAMPVAELIARHQGLFGSDSTVVTISPSNSSALTEAYHQLTSRGGAAAFFLIDGADFGGPSPAAAGRSLIQLGAPVYLLRKADSCAQSLEQAAGAPGWVRDWSRS
ncbi:DUF58 domain-containing protein [Dehalogenimonas alkenigignens]|uniref:DUF58 domain-containing protein n=1 Tax=Dehalogenimonas alkenigignens TaxID=1217799 RepID=UPI001403368B|nr:DUF58 domain-containing protein [Dehalogenimonas alkenigignens]